MGWISATTLEDRNVNLQTSQIAAILDRVPREPREGSEVRFASGFALEVKESPAELLRSIESEERPGDPSVSPREAW
ncbi:MAG: hypothetical protein ABUT39_29215 [Acidobacteriota bacterium]